MIHGDEFIMNLYHGRIISKLLDKVCILLHNSQKKKVCILLHHVLRCPELISEIQVCLDADSRYRNF